jgi:hypothetical protein
MATCVSSTRALDVQYHTISKYCTRQNTVRNESVSILFVCISLEPLRKNRIREHLAVSIGLLLGPTRMGKDVAESDRRPAHAGASHGWCGRSLQSRSHASNDGSRLLVGLGQRSTRASTKMPNGCALAPPKKPFAGGQHRLQRLQVDKSTFQICLVSFNAVGRCAVCTTHFSLLGIRLLSMSETSQQSEKGLDRD